jgi:hypothetical protein
MLRPHPEPYEIYVENKNGRSRVRRVVVDVDGGITALAPTGKVDVRDGRLHFDAPAPGRP